MIRSNTPVIESGDDEDYHRHHGKSPTGLSHSTSAPGNIGYPKQRPRNEESLNSSDDSRSTNQQDSRPGSSREKVRNTPTPTVKPPNPQPTVKDRHPQQQQQQQQQQNPMMIQQNGPHPAMYSKQMGQYPVQTQNVNQQNPNMAPQQIPMVRVSVCVFELQSNPLFRFLYKMFKIITL